MAAAHSVALSGARGLAPTVNKPIATIAMPSIFTGGGISSGERRANATNIGAMPRDSV